MVKSPVTYKEWVECFEKYKREDFEDEVLNAMKNGEFQWNDGVAERISTHLFKLLEFKISVLQDVINKRFQKQANSKFEVERNLIYIRRTLKRLLAFSELEVFPKELRDEVKRYIVNSANSLQTSLEDSSKVDRTGVITSIIKRNAVNKFEDVQAIDNVEKKESKDEKNSLIIKRSIKL